MSTIKQHIEVDASIEDVYHQWTLFEKFPEFMGTISAVQQKDPTTLHWKANILGVEREWDSKIIEQTPHQAIAWQSYDGIGLDGHVDFEPIGPSRCAINLTLVFRPEGFAEKTSDAIGLVELRARDDLKRFKKLIEKKDHADGGWDGEIHGGKQVETSTAETSTLATPYVASGAVGSGYTATGSSFDDITSPEREISSSQQDAHDGKGPFALGSDNHDAPKGL